MELILEQPYLSLRPFQAILPDFVVLTGLNGVGKTHILRSIKDGSSHLDDILTRQRINTSRILYVTNTDLYPNAVILRSDQANDHVAYLAEQHKRYKIDAEKSTNINYASYFDVILDRTIVNVIAEKAKKEIIDLEVSDFYTYYPSHIVPEGINIFGVNLAAIFKRYFDRQDGNNYNRYLKSQGEVAEVLSVERFKELYGDAPWELINDILAETSLNVKVQVPTRANVHEMHEIKLIHTENGKKISFSDLSSGEKAIIALVIAMYNVQNAIGFPEALLLDEPDASMHPSMTKFFFKIVHRIFVQEKKIKVIITTHSPTTVVLAPEESLYLISRTDPMISHVTKDKAIKALTVDIPTLSIRQENRRQVFVEAPNDENFYGKIFQLLNDQYLKSEVSLLFIQSGASATDKNKQPIANCDQVRRITELLRESGNHLIWGIIDRDVANKSTESVLVLGQENRYSIENYIFDPVLIGGLLLREKLFTAEQMNLPQNLPYNRFDEFDNASLQAMTNFVCDNIAIAMVGLLDQTPQTETYINGKTTAVPKWYFETQGHDLEKYIVKSFPELASIKKNREDLLKLHILDHIVGDFPGYLSTDFLDVFAAIQS
jgi:predicted ATP-binding protein involved in virulence